MDRILVSEKQAREFARVLYADIKEYISRHPAEYAAFLHEEKTKEDGEK